MGHSGGIGGNEELMLARYKKNLEIFEMVKKECMECKDKKKNAKLVKQYSESIKGMCYPHPELFNFDIEKLEATFMGYPLYITEEEIRQEASRLAVIEALRESMK